MRFFTLLFFATAAFTWADVARPVMQSSNTKALTDDLATGAKGIKISAAGNLVWESGATLTGGSALKTALGMGNVENTALSSWVGSTNITTLGTITAGVWHGTPIGLGYLAAGGATDGQLLAFSGGAWIPVSYPSIITPGTTSISGGTSGRLLYNNAGVLGEMALGSGVATLLGTPSSANLAAALTDETGTGKAVFHKAPVFDETGDVFMSGTKSANGYDIWKLSANGGVNGTLTLYSYGSYPLVIQSSFGAMQINNLIYCFTDNIVKFQAANSNGAYSNFILASDGITSLGVMQMGQDADTPTAQSIKAHDATGTDHDAADLQLMGGQSTGTGAPGNVIFRTASAGSTGSSLNSYTTRMTVSPAGVTIGTRGSAVSAVATVVKVAYNPANIAAGGTETTTATITGCADGSTYIASPAKWQGLMVTVTKTASNTVTIEFYNPTGTGIDAAATDVRVTEIAY